ncbi:MAG: ECF-type sigma factor, partial [Sulfitobacter sp.]|nr:ECF-type sigma factor [Sulfitobacter sp.]
QSLLATELVHEAYLRLVGSEDLAWESRGHFFGAAAEAMRRILIDRARAKGTGKRGASWKRIALDPAGLSFDEVPPELLDLDEALRRFEALDKTKAELVKLRFFTGLSMAQAAEILGISTATATRHWAYARAWLHNELSEGESSGQESPKA